MSYVVVLVGQCGNQLGESLFAHLHRIHDETLPSGTGRPSSNARAASPSDFSPWFSHVDGKARCVLFDTEPKVIQQIVERNTIRRPTATSASNPPSAQASSSSLFRSENCIYGQSGRGNNWALGYHGVNQPENRRSETHAKEHAFQMRKDQRTDDDKVIGRVLRAIQRETRHALSRRSVGVGNEAQRKEAHQKAKQRKEKRARGEWTMDDEDYGEDDGSDASDYGGSGSASDYYGDCFEAVIVIHSLAGGTGSGAASRLLEKIRYYFVQPPPGIAVDELKEAQMMERDGLSDGLYMEKKRAKSLVSIAVAPQLAGENPTQGINAALALHTIQRFADIGILLRNDDGFLSSATAFATSSNSSHSAHRRAVGSVGPSGRAGAGSSAVRNPFGTFEEVNEYFVSLLLPVLHYGYTVTAIDELVQQCCPRNSQSNNSSSNKLVTLMPIPQRVFNSFQHSTTRCMFFELLGGKELMPGTRPYIPIDTILTEAAVRDVDNAAAWISMEVPPPFLRSSTTRGTSTRNAVRGHLARDITLNLEGVVALNQTAELSSSLLFPLLLDCAVKVRAGAYVSSYEEAGVSSEQITAAYQSVARTLSNNETSFRRPGIAPGRNAQSNRGRTTARLR